MSTAIKGLLYFFYLAQLIAYANIHSIFKLTPLPNITKLVKWRSLSMFVLPRVICTQQKGQSEKAQMVMDVNPVYACQERHQVQFWQCSMNNYT